MNTRTKTIGKYLLPCPAAPLELLLFSVFSKIMIGCFVVGCVVGGDLKVQVFEPVAEVPLSPSIIGLFAIFHHIQPHHYLRPLLLLSLTGKQR